MKQYEVSVFQDSEGNEIRLYILGRLEYEGKTYAALLDASAAENESGQNDSPAELLIMECSTDNESEYETFSPIEDEETLSVVSEIIYTVLFKPDEIKQ